MASYPAGNLSIPGPAGRLECIRWPAEGVAPWAVVSHPHPQFGGTMHNKVVYRMARALQAAGYGVLRFNFRGVGGSTGTHDGGRGEADDVRAAIEFVAGHHDSRPLLLAGFSFGAWVNARVGCDDARVSRLLHAGLAAGFLDLDFLSGCDRPTAVVQGDRDQYGEWSRVEAVTASMPRVKVLRIEGANHFFEGRIAELDAALAEAIRWLDDPGATRPRARS